MSAYCKRKFIRILSVTTAKNILRISKDKSLSINKTNIRALKYCENIPPF